MEEKYAHEIYDGNSGYGFLKHLKNIFIEKYKEKLELKKNYLQYRYDKNFNGANIEINEKWKRILIRDLSAILKVSKDNNLKTSESLNNNFLSFYKLKNNENAKCFKLLLNENGSDFDSKYEAFFIELICKLTNLEGDNIFSASVRNYIWKIMELIYSEMNLKKRLDNKEKLSHAELQAFIILQDELNKLGNTIKNFKPISAEKNDNKKYQNIKALKIAVSIFDEKLILKQKLEINKKKFSASNM